MTLFIYICAILFLQTTAQTANRNSNPASWCLPPGCAPLPANLVQKLNDTLNHELKNASASSSSCGDGICNVFGGETCQSCPKDCGACRFQEVIRSCKNANQIAITFDDGPTASVTANLLKTASELKIPLTLFVNGAKIIQDAKLGEVIKQAHQAGHAIASHTYSHRGLANGQNSGGTPNSDPYMPIGLLRQELLWNDLVIQEVIGKRPLLFRPPYLDMNATVLRILDTIGYYPIDINVDTKDYELQSRPNGKNEISNRFRTEFQAAKKSQNAYISLQHDLFQKSVDALPDIVAYVKSQGVSVVSMAECLGIQEIYRPNNMSIISRNATNTEQFTPATTTLIASVTPVPGSGPLPVPPPPDANVDKAKDSKSNASSLQMLNSMNFIIAFSIFLLS